MRNVERNGIDRVIKGTGFARLFDLFDDGKEGTTLLASDRSRRAKRLAMLRLETTRHIDGRSFTIGW